jgi:hypothetical protein
MSAERFGKFHAFAWLMAILAVPVLYLLSVYPVLSLTADPDIRPWARQYARPYVWVYDHTPLWKPLDNYTNWFSRTTAPYRKQSPPPELFPPGS